MNYKVSTYTINLDYNLTYSEILHIKAMQFSQNKRLRHLPTMQLSKIEDLKRESFTIRYY